MLSLEDKGRKGNKWRLAPLTVLNFLLRSTKVQNIILFPGFGFGANILGKWYGYKHTGAAATTTTGTGTTTTTTTTAAAAANTTTTTTTITTTISITTIISAAAGVGAVSNSVKYILSWRAIIPKLI